MRKRLIGILSVPALIVLAIGAYYIPPIHEHLAWRLDDVRTRLIYFFHPPGQAVFHPEVSKQNVMPYELQDFITQNVPGMSSVLRYGGDMDVVKRLVAGGFPVVAEKGEYQYDLTGQESWMGHYQYITGYDDATQTLIIQDTYKTVLGGGPNYHVSYGDFMKEWRSFDYIFVVVYPTDPESA